MFTGIIEGFGKLTASRSFGQSKRLTIDADFPLDGTKIGDSIAVNGACLTAVRITGQRFDVDAAPETLQRTIIGKSKIGDRMNLERALRLSDRLDGHLVSGHVDGIGTIASRSTLANAILITVTVPAQLTRYMIEKGSVAVDGVSLTINRVGTDAFDVSIIPHTAGLTTIGFKKPGDAVNIETDMIGKYIEKFVKTPGTPMEMNETSKINMAFLAKSGFL